MARTMDEPGATFAARVEVEGEAAVLRLVGELDLSRGEAAEAGLAKALGQSPSGQVVIDMRELAFIDSTGISILVRAIKEHGSSLSIRESEALAVRRVLGLVGIPDLALSSGAFVDVR